jgi:cytochrome P450
LKVKTFLIAGHITTSSLLAWTACFLSSHPDVQEKAYQEVKEVLGDREPTADDVSKLRYIKAILEETLRIRPVAPLLRPKVSPTEGFTSLLTI